MKGQSRVNRKVIDYQELLNEEPSEATNTIEEKIESAKPNNLNKILSKYTQKLSFLTKAFNLKEENIRNTFIIMIFVYWIEYMLIGLTVTIIII
jgi:hypothetical protein